MPDTKHDDGGAAFPTEPPYMTLEGWSGEAISAGMSLLDYFAAQATDEDIAFYMPSKCGDLAKLLLQVGFIEPAEGVPSYQRYTEIHVAKLRCWARYQHAEGMIAEKRRRESQCPNRT